MQRQRLGHRKLARDHKRTVNSYVYETGEETAARSVNAAVLLLCQSVLYYGRQSSVGRTKQVMRASLRTVEWAMVSTGWSKSDSPVLILR